MITPVTLVSVVLVMSLTSLISGNLYDDVKLLVQTNTYFTDGDGATTGDNKRGRNSIGAGAGSEILRGQEVKEVKDSEVDVLFPLSSI